MLYLSVQLGTILYNAVPVSTTLYISIQHCIYSDNAAQLLQCCTTLGKTTVAVSGLFSVISWLLLSHFLNISNFITISQSFLTYFSGISQKFFISKLFLVYFSVISHFSTTSQLLLDYFLSTSQSFLNYF